MVMAGVNVLVCVGVRARVAVGVRVRVLVLVGKGVLVFSDVGDLVFVLVGKGVFVFSDVGDLVLVLVGRGVLVGGGGVLVGVLVGVTVRQRLGQSAATGAAQIALPAQSLLLTQPMTVNLVQTKSVQRPMKQLGSDGQSSSVRQNCPRPGTGASRNNVAATAIGPSLPTSSLD